MTLVAKKPAEHSTNNQPAENKSSRVKVLSLEELEKTAVPASKILRQCTRSQTDRRQSENNFLPSKRPASQERRGGRDRRLSFY